MNPRVDKRASDRKRTAETIDFPVVGIGASAGGLEPAVELFKALDRNPDMALILIQHLKPEHVSHLVDILRRRIEQEVVEARDGTHLERNKVYVITPGTYLTLDGRTLVAKPTGEVVGPPSPIDVCFRSLAENGVQRAIGIVLSGTGSDGTLGLKAIKERGGMTMAQDPEEASQGGMPRSAIRAGIVDHVLSPYRMAEALKSYVQHPYVASIGETAEAEVEEHDELEPIVALLRTRTRHDFQHYRTPTLHRRVQRRMGLRHITSYPAYLEFLRENPEEINLLAMDLLVSVTDFFREPDAWDVLKEKAIRPLIERQTPDRTIRAWVPGCATGEEAYSLGMVIKEELDRAQVWAKVQVFGTDVSDRAIAHARAGVYPAAIAGDIGQDRLRRFFREVGDDHHYRVSQDIRDMLIFARQDVIADPPFTRVEVITCRNLLIYLRPATEEKVISLFHFSLRPDGYLFLGPAEGIGRSHRFAPVSKKWKIYRRIGATHHEDVEFPIASTGETRFRTPELSVAPEAIQPRDKRDFTRSVQKAIIDHLGPTSVVIDRNHQIQYFSGSTDKYLAHPGGEPTRNLLDMARKGLQSRLRSAIYRAAERSAPVAVTAALKRGEDSAPVRIQVTPLLSPREGEGLLLISFEDLDPSRHDVASTVEDTEAEESTVRQLEHELAATRDDLQTKVEQLETSNEELRTANEEVRSMNEELQSANEELETSKEELQSLNEELSTVNQQLENKIEELEASHNDLKNLLSSTEIATLFLGPDLRIRRFTPTVTRLVNLLATDLGRPITDFARAIAGEDLVKQALTVLRDLQPIEEEVQSEEGKWYIRRILPYRTEDDHINGVVVTYLDISQRLRSQRALERAEAELRQVNESLESEVEHRTAQLEILQDVAVAANRAHSVEEAIRVALQRICEYSQWALGHAHLRDEVSSEFAPTGLWHATPGVRFEALRQATMRQRFKKGECVAGRAAEAGEPLWVKDLEEEPAWQRGTAEGLHSAAFLPIRIGERIVGVLEFFSARVIEPDERFTRLLRNVGIQLGYVFERKELERRIAELADTEHRRIGEELHDSIGQQITAVSLLASGLQKKLGGRKAPETGDTQEIVEQLEAVKGGVAALIEGLIPIEVRAESLGDALTTLAERSTRIYGIHCRFEGPASIAVRSDSNAMHLYRIAQEAVVNAVKHGEARNVIVELRDDPERDRTILSIRDDGRGFSEPAETTSGMGLRIMRHRASLLGGDLLVRDSGKGGVIVECIIQADV